MLGISAKVEKQKKLFELSQTKPVPIRGKAPIVMSVTQSCRWVMQCRLRAQRPLASNKGLRPCPMRTETSPISLNLLMMLCTIDDESCKAFAIWCWGTLFLKFTVYSTIFLRTLSQIGEPKPNCTFERLCLSKTCLL